MIYNIPDLQKAYNSGCDVPLKFFYGHQHDPAGLTNSCFSQWWMCSFVVDGITYNCAEQYMMAEKARLFEDESACNAIMSSTHPEVMKRIGRRVKDFNEVIWDTDSYDIVKRGNYAKFSQDKHLKNFLLATNKAILVEASPWDTVWGIGLGVTNPSRLNPNYWNGLNLLGFALTEVRDRIAKEGTQ